MLNQKQLFLLIVGLVLIALAGWYVLVGRDGGRLLPDALMSDEPIRYVNEEHRFSLMLPRSWDGYQVSAVSNAESEGAVVMIGLPVERYRSLLEQPDDLKQGVMAAGIRIFSKESVMEERELCQEAQETIDRYQVAMSQGTELVLSADEAALVDDCLLLYDPEFPASPAIKEAYLGESDAAYFFRVPLAEFDNGFREMPEGLEGETAAVYQSFKVE